MKHTRTLVASTLIALVGHATANTFFTVDVANDVLYYVTSAGVATPIGPLGVDVDDVFLDWHGDPYMIASVAGVWRAYQLVVEGPFKGRAVGGATVTTLGGMPILGFTNRGGGQFWIAALNGNSTQFNKINMRTGAIDYSGGFSVGVRFDALGWNEFNDFCFTQTSPGSYFTTQSGSSGWTSPGFWNLSGAVVRDLAMDSPTHLMGIDSASARLVRVPKAGGAALGIPISGGPGTAMYRGIAKAPHLFGYPAVIGIKKEYWTYEPGYGVCQVTLNGTATAASGARLPVPAPAGTNVIGLTEGAYMVPTNVLFALVRNPNSTGRIAQVVTTGQLAGTFIFGAQMPLLTGPHAISYGPAGLMGVWARFDGLTGIGTIDPVSGAVNETTTVNFAIGGIAYQWLGLHTTWAVGPVGSPTFNRLYRRDNNGAWQTLNPYLSAAQPLQSLTYASNTRLITTEPGIKALIHWPAGATSGTICPVAGISGTIVNVTRRSMIFGMAYEN